MMSFELQSAPTHARAWPTQSPIDRVWQTYADDLRDLPGVVTARGENNEIHVSCASEDLARLADNVVVDSIDGVRILFEPAPDCPTTPSPPVTTGPAAGKPWFDDPRNMARAAASLRGITGWHWDGGTYVLEAQAIRDITHLRPLLEPQFNGSKVEIS